LGLPFAPDGALYGAVDFDPHSPTFNSLYTLDVHTGLATRIGSLGAGVNETDYIMSFAWDSHGNLYGASMMALYRIHRNRTTNMATKVVDLVGPSLVMGLAIDEGGRFYAADISGPQTLSTIY